jgi:hypothetical protein
LNVKKIEALGCRVELASEDPNNPTATPYVLNAASGREYALVRQLANPELMFLVSRETDNPARLAGYSWFTDAEGELRPLG